jgi:signal transduction histidine kinase
VQSSKAAGEKLMPNISVSVITASPSIDSSSTAASSAIPQLKNQEGDWRLFVQHRNGSLVSAVETMRRRNSIIGFGMLLLLASSGVLLIVLLNRSRGFARRQTDFVAGVTHELRTPLAVIRAASENIADGIVTDAAQIREYGVMINEEERRLSAMVEQVLEFAGAQQLTRNNRYEFTPDSVAEILEAALNDYQTELKERGFRVVLEIEPHLPEIMADRDALRRAVGNLIGNAVKYSNRTEERRIVIKARSVQKKASEQIEITLEDNGAGIEKSELPHIFKLFYRGRTATENQIKGSGIGLSLVKQIVKAHGGSISVKSETGRGSAFTLRLPVE